MAYFPETSLLLLWSLVNKTQSAKTDTLVLKQITLPQAYYFNLSPKDKSKTCCELNDGTNIISSCNEQTISAGWTEVDK